MNAPVRRPRATARRPRPGLPAAGADLPSPADDVPVPGGVAVPPPSLFVRVMLAPKVPLGPGKADLLQAIAETGSIAAAARRLGMSYQRAHDLVAELNGRFAEPLVAAAKGGAGRGGAVLTPLGERVLQAYRDLVQAAGQAAAPQLDWLAAQLRR